MAQRKKTEVREAILKSAYQQFRQKGYGGTSIPQIAAGASVSTANVYVYFKSKMEIIFAIYEPWMLEQFEKLETTVETIADPHARLRMILKGLWYDLPALNNGFMTHVIQAVSTTSQEEGYNSHAIRWAEAKITGMIRRTLDLAGAPTASAATVAHIAFMTMDGFALNFHLNPWAKCDDATIDCFCRLLLPATSSPKQAPATRIRKPTRAAMSARLT